MHTLKISKIKINDSDYQFKFGSKQDYDTILSQTSIVRDAATGLIVAGLFKKAISLETAKNAYPAFMAGFGYVTDNRGSYQGEKRKQETQKRSRTTEPVHSYTGGYFERQGGFTPICRATSFTREQNKAWRKQIPFLKEMATVVQENDPLRYSKLMDYIGKIQKDYTIDGLPFTTTAVNLSVRAAYHRDRGDYKGGVGCMAVLKKGVCINWKLVLPEYRVALDIGDRDVILFDPHLLHATTKGTGIGEIYKDWNRISVVAYVRERLIKCLPHEEEIKRARMRK